MDVIDPLEAKLADASGTVARIARELFVRCRLLTNRRSERVREITTRIIRHHVPTLHG